MAGRRRFPKSFLWGVATSAHQVEGDQANNWSEWEKSASKELAETAEARLSDAVLDWDAIKDQATKPKNYISGKAAGHYTRYKQDIKRIADLGLNSFIFSVEWSRVEPEPGVFDKNALAHYKKVAAECRKYNIEPIVTLHHFTNPLWFDGWHRKHATVIFEKYVEAVAAELSEHVRYWIPINEPTAVVFMRYLGGTIWPAWPQAEFNPWKAFFAYRHLVQSHKKAYRRIREVNESAQIAFVHGWVSFKPKRIVGPSALVARFADWFNNWLLFWPARNYSDFVALHYYVAATVNVGFSNPSQWVSQYGRDAEFVSNKGWAADPDGLLIALKKLSKQHKKPVLIAENGISDPDDTIRARFIYRHLESIHAAIKSGVEVIGYHYWTLLDNFEWSEGYWEKFGLFAVDRKTLKRTKRQSADYYGSLAKANELKAPK